MKTVLRKKARNNVELAEKLASEVLLPEIIIEYLCDHGYDTKEKILHFINFEEKDLRKVSQMKDGLAFLERLAKAVKNNERIIIYGDYDGDGVCATTIFVRTLRLLGANVNYFISNRFIEGYGLSVKGMERLLKTFPDTNLIVTCDNGIVAFDGVEYAKGRGVDVIVSDHHNASPDGRLPDCPVVCEKRLDEDPTQAENFCGAELARRLSFGLMHILKRFDDFKCDLMHLYGFSAFATITDVIELNAANHYVAQKGLNLINDELASFNCFKALHDVLEMRKAIDETTIGYHFGPMVNAAGRITGDANIAVDLFLSDEYADAVLKAKTLIELNTIRQEKSLEQQHLALEEYIAKDMQNDKFIILSGIDEKYYDEGIAGLIASYIVENFKKPCICLAKTEKDGIYKGSARSVEGFNVKSALDASKSLLLGYGGHPMAAGLSVEERNIDNLRDRLNELSVHTEELEDIVEFDYLEDISHYSFEMINTYQTILAPFGVGFEKPVFASVGIFDKNIKIMKDKHIKTKLISKGKQIDLLWFNSLTQYDMIEPNEQVVFVTGQPDLNEFNGRVTTQFIVDRLFVK